MMLYSRVLIFISLALLVTCDKFRNSCQYLQDGTHQLKFIDDEKYPAVSVKCSNGYAILDYSIDNTISQYFSSWERWHTKVFGPSNTEHINWSEWFLPDSNTNIEWEYLLSSDCNTCDDLSASYGTTENPSWYMTGSIFGCYWKNMGEPSCDVDFESYTCYECKDKYNLDGVESILSSIPNSETDIFQTGVCPVNVATAKESIVSNHFDCASYQSEDIYRKEKHLKPSIGGFGQFCECVKPSTIAFYEGEPTTPKVAQEASSEYLYVELYQKDFDEGTYRITEPGTYTIMEDIEFDFNKGNILDPHNYDSWWPQSEQSDDYPGAGAYKDAFFMGFFAGITIETDNVILNLNGNQISQSLHFYYLQRWFTNIEIGSQYFLPGQGFANFGGDVKTPSNIIIKDGIIGLTSHHGIHGNNNKNIMLQDLIIKEFETHGIQLNGFENLEINHVDVGPTSSKVYLSGEYAHMRAVLPRFISVAKENSDAVKFYGRDSAVTMQDIVDEIQQKMDMIWRYVVMDEYYDEKDLDFQKAKRLFYNEGGLPYGSGVYGVFLNTYGANRYTYNLYSTLYSENVQITNLEIHDLSHKMKEYVSFSSDGLDFYVNPISSPLSALEIFDDISNPKNYKGNIITDGYILMEYLSDNWNYLGNQILGKNKLIDFAINNNKKFIKNNKNNKLKLNCNNDAMLQSGKGINGLRIDSIKHGYIENVRIFNLNDYTPLGNDICGKYSQNNKKSFKGNFKQTSPMQIGFTGNHVQGIQINSALDVQFKDINVHDLESKYGPVKGIAVWPANEVVLNGDIEVYNLKAGTDLDHGVLTYESRPNLSPEACGILIYYEYYSPLYSHHFTSTVAVTSDTKINSYQINGHVGCRGTENIPSMIGYGGLLNDNIGKNNPKKNKL